MRFIFHDPEQAAEQRARELLLERVDAFWSSLASGSGWSESCQLLARVDVRLVMEKTSIPEQSIVITSDVRALRPLVDTVIERAPARSDWQLLAGRPRLSLDEALEQVRRVSGIDASNARFRAGFSRGHLLEIVVYLSPPIDGRKSSAAETLVESLLGQEQFDAWVGSVDVAELARRSSLPVVGSARPSATTHPIGELCSTLERAIAAVYRELPERRLHECAAAQSWTMLEATPQPSHDYAEQHDIAVASSSLPELLKCFLEGAPFSSRRFSRHEERFCYLKFDHSGFGLPDTVRRRAELEDALDRALIEAGVGCVIGNGVGLRYGYVDLALGVPGQGVQIAREVARHAGLPARSWIQFCDGEWADEWVGIAPHAPAPPGLGSR